MAAEAIHKQLDALQKHNCVCMCVCAVHCIGTVTTQSCYVVLEIPKVEGNLQVKQQGSKKQAILNQLFIELNRPIMDSIWCLLDLYCGLTWSLEHYLWNLNFLSQIIRLRVKPDLLRCTCISTSCSGINNGTCSWQQLDWKPLNHLLFSYLWQVIFNDTCKWVQDMNYIGSVDLQ